MILMTPSYRILMQDHHAANDLWGTNHNADYIKIICEIFGTSDVLDYGCGKGALAKNLPFGIREYDPAISGKDALPAPADIIHCNQIIQHVEPECIDSVLAHLSYLTKKVCCIWSKISTSATVFADGRNATLTKRPSGWWFSKFYEHFPDTVIRNGFYGTPSQIKSVIIREGILY